jgi:hypothetical protein
MDVCGCCVLGDSVSAICACLSIQSRCPGAVVRAVCVQDEPIVLPAKVPNLLVNGAQVSSRLYQPHRQPVPLLAAASTAVPHGCMPHSSSSSHTAFMTACMVVYQLACAGSHPALIRYHGLNACVGVVMACRVLL